VSLELPRKEVELRRAALDHEDFGGTSEGGQSDIGHAQNARRHVAGRHSQGRSADHCFLQEILPQGRRPARRRRGRHEHALPPPRLHVSALLEILNGARHRVRIDAEEARQLSDARQRLLPRDASALDGVLQLLRQLPADRDRAVDIHAQAHRHVHAV